VVLALFVTTIVLASPLVVEKNTVTIPFVRRLNTTGAASLVQSDRARARFLKNGRGGSSLKATVPDAIFGVPSTNQVVDYVITAGIGEPPTNFVLLVDTGSSNTWIGANLANPYRVTPTSTDTGSQVSVTYGSGSFSGEEFTDDITLAPGFVIKNQQIGVAKESSGFEGVDGILGIGPEDLTCGTILSHPSTCIPTVTQNAFNQGLINAPVVGISFEPTTQTTSVNGELSFGGTDASKFNGTIQTVPITTTSPANEFVGISQSITYGTSKTPILSTTAGISDTGTTLLLIASDAFAKYQTATGGKLDEDTGLLRVTPAQFSKLQSLFFTIGTQTYEFTANAQAWPRSLNTLIGGTSSFVYLIVSDLGSPSGEGLDFIDGMVFLERYYTVFDSGKSTFGIAETKFTFATTN